MRIVIWAFYAWLIYWLLKKVIGAFLAGSRKAKASRPESQEMVYDKMCNTYLLKANAIKKTAAGQDYYFCSKECYARFGK